VISVMLSDIGETRAVIFGENIPDSTILFIVADLPKLFLFHLTIEYSFNH